MKSETRAEQLFCLGYGSVFILPSQKHSKVRGLCWEKQFGTKVYR